MIDHLQESTGSAGTSPERQSTLDAHIRARINAELGRLREEERVVREQIEAALEKENLTKERSGTDGDEAEGGVNSSSSVQGALDEVQKRVDRFHAKRDLGGYLVVSESSQKLIECYRYGVCIRVEFGVLMLSHSDPITRLHWIVGARSTRSSQRWRRKNR